MASFVGSAISDPDPGARVGIALVDLGDSSSGSWQFSVDAGDSWDDVGAVSSNSARLLRDIDWLRFVPSPDFNGIAMVTFHAWDQMSGSASGLADVATGTGGTTAFSTASDTASITVTPVNDAPVLTDPGRSDAEARCPDSGLPPADRQ